MPDSTQDVDGVLRQLQEIKDRAPHVDHDRVERLMHTCTQQIILGTADWFLAEITAIADDEHGTLNRWDDWMRLMIVTAAARQVPATTTCQALPIWLRLLEIPLYATIALLALTETPPDTVRHLGTWWQTQPWDRARSIGEIMMQVHAGLAPALLLEELRARRDHWPSDLQEAVNAALQDKFQGPIFEPTNQPVSR